MKKRVALILIMILINLTLVITPTLASGDEDNDLTYYNSVKSQEFFDLNPGDKQKVWKDSETWEGIKTRTEKQTAIIELTNNIIEQRIEANKLTKGYIAIMELGGSVLLENFKEAGLNDFLGIDLSEIYKNKKNLGQYLKDTYGIDFDIQETKLESIVGFDSSKLTWSEEAGENKNIIGDGNVWLDLEKIPTGVTGIEYKEGDTKGGKYTGGSFILTHNSGMEIVLAPGTTNPDGTIKFLSQYYEDYKEPGDKKLFRIDGINLPPPNLRNFNFPTTSSDGSPITGKVIFTENGFKLTGDAQVKYSQFSFTGTKLGEDSQESYIQFHKDKFIIKGTKFERQDYLISQPTKDDFIIHFGTIEYLGKDEDGNEIKDFASLNLDGLVKQASFEDSEAATMGDVINPIKRKSITSPASKQIHFKFNEQGELTHVSKDNINDGKLIPLTIGLRGESYLKDIYEQSGTTVKEIIDTATQGESIGYNDIKKLFYEDSTLKENARQIKIDSYQDNFVSIMGENVFVGGKGDIEILKPLNSLTGVDAKDFSVNVGELPLRFSESGIWKKRGGHEGETFNINSITAIKSGELMDTILTTPNNEKKPVTSFTINTNNPQGKIYTESETLTAGREILAIVNGITVDVYTKLDKENLPEVSALSGYSYRNQFIDQLLESDLSVNIDVYVPKGLTLKGDKVKKILDDIVFPRFFDALAMTPLPIEPETKRVIKRETAEKISTISTQSVKDVQAFKGGKFSLSYKKDGTIDIQFPEQGVKTITGHEELIKDTRQALIRLPRLEERTVNFDFYYVFGEQTYLWPRDYLYPLWKRTIGNTGSRSRVSGPSDNEFFYGDMDRKPGEEISGGYIGKYTLPVPSKKQE